MTLVCLAPRRLALCLGQFFRQTVVLLLLLGDLLLESRSIGTALCGAARLVELFQLGLGVDQLAHERVGAREDQGAEQGEAAEVAVASARLRERRGRAETVSNACVRRRRRLATVRTGQMPV